MFRNYSLSKFLRFSEKKFDSGSGKVGRKLVTYIMQITLYLMCNHYPKEMLKLLRNRKTHDTYSLPLQY